MEEREVVSQMFAAGHSRKAIAARLGRSRSTIVRELLTREWSPDQIAGRLKLTQAEDLRFHLAPQTSYTWIEQDCHAEHWQTFLRRGGRPKKSPRTGRIPRQVQIDGRPAEANQRLRLGDFEGDTIVSRGKRSGLVTLVDRKSRYLLAAKLKNRTARRTRQKIEHLLAPLPADQRHRRDVRPGGQIRGRAS